MGKLSVVVIFMFALAAISTALPKSTSRGVEGRMVGGQNATDGQFPYQVVITYNDSYSCGGTIIGPLIVLTTANCVSLSDPYARWIVAGVTDRSGSPNSQYIRMARHILHPRYHFPSAYANNIAIVILSQPLVFNEWVQPISLPVQGQETTGQVIVSGWGQVTGTTYSSRLQWAQVPTVNGATCRASLPDQTIHEHMLCSGTGPIPGGGGETCSGDNGGAVVAVDGGYLAGIVSYRPVGCGLPGLPGINIKVSHFIDWINQETDNISNNS